MVHDINRSMVNVLGQQGDDALRLPASACALQLLRRRCDLNLQNGFACCLSCHFVIVGHSSLTSGLPLRRLRKT